MRIIIVVDNPVVGDSRVQKQARSVIEAGHDVIVVGLSVREVVGPDSVNGIPVLRFTVPSHYYSWERRGRLLRANETVVVEQAKAVTAYALTRSRAARLEGSTASAVAWQLRARIAPLASKVRRAPRRALRSAHGWVRQLLGRAIPRWWQVSAGHLVDLETVLVPILVDLAPDVIHVNDPQPLGAAIRARSLLSATKKVALVYDAHEWWQAVASGELVHHVGAYGLEQLYAREADAVVTVTAEIADRLQRRYRLGTRPTVVRNLPLTVSSPAPGRRRLREELGLSPETPLLVYSGALHARRGVAEAIGALAELSDTHLALVTGRNQADLRDIVALAQGLGVSERVHVRDYVPSRSVSWYLTGASLGLSPMRRHPNHDLAIPTKLAEYLQAGLPLIVSDCPAQMEFVQDRHAGVVYRSGDSHDLARAIREGLGSLDDLRDKARAAAVDLSWERDASTLIDVYERLGPAAAPPRPRTGELVLGRGRVADALLTTGGTALSPASSPPTTSEAIGALIRARNAQRVIVDGSPLGLELLARPLHVLNFLEASGTQTALVLHHESDVSGLLEHVRLFVTSPHLLDRFDRSAWLPIVASDEALRVGAALEIDAPIQRIAFDGSTLAPAWAHEINALAERTGLQIVDSGCWEAADIFVDYRRADEHTELRVDHLAAGAVVVSRAARASGEHPVITVTDPDSLVREIWRLMEDRGALAAARQAAITYAAEHHGASSTRTRIDQSFG